MAPAPLEQAAFTWLRDLLWPPDVVDETARRYAVVTRDNRPRLVVPLGSRAVLANALGRTTADVSIAQTLTRRAAAFAASIGIVQPLLRHRFRSGRPAELASIEDFLASALGLPAVEIVATIGPPRPNRKPVLQLFTPDGATVGFAKVGWNGLTRGLVQHEADVLRTLSERGSTRIRFPKVLHLGTWRDLEISILSPLAPPAGSLAQRRDPSTVELLELAGLGRRHSATLSESSYAARTRSRIGAVDQPRRTTYSRALDRIAARGGDQVLEFGWSHGDWAPWNMTPLPDELLVWDWERAGEDMPVLFDAIHYVFQREWLRRDRGPTDAVAAAIEHAAQHAPAFGLSESALEIIAHLYLVELGLRYAENAAAGTDELRAERHATVDATLQALT